MPSSKKNASDSYKIRVGRNHEQLAAKYFIEQQYKILEKNWRAGKKEIDLIIQKDSLIVFVEVKYSSSKKFGHPSERVDKKKIENLTYAAQQYIIAKEIQNVDLRFDVVTFVDGKLEHFENAFEAAE